MGVKDNCLDEAMMLSGLGVADKGLGCPVL